MSPFDDTPQRRGSGSYKWDSAASADVIPLWVADMDFRTAPVVVEALRRRVDHGVFGYTLVGEDYYEALRSWFAGRHGYAVDTSRVIYTSGVVPAISAVIQGLCRPGDGGIVQTTVYNCFFSSIRNNGCRIVECPLVTVPAGEGEFSYRMDFDTLDRLAADPANTMLLLCNPHNPGGRVWTPGELRSVRDICARHGVQVVSDEIHGDLVLGRRSHIPFLAVSDDARAVGVMLGAPSKTFNIPGLVSSWMVVKSEGLRRDFYKWMEVNEFSAPVMISTIGAEAAYTTGEQWLDEMMEYVESNISFATEYVSSRIPGVRVVKPQASFLLWLDFNGLGLEQKDLMRMLVDDARIAANDGTMFGKQGKGLARLNVGTPRCVLTAALEHIREAVEKINAK